MIRFIVFALFALLRLIGRAKFWLDDRLSDMLEPLRREWNDD